MKFRGLIWPKVCDANGTEVIIDQIWNLEFGVVQQLDSHLEKYFPERDIDKNLWQTCDGLIDYALAEKPPTLPELKVIINAKEYTMTFHE